MGSPRAWDAFAIALVEHRTLWLTLAWLLGFLAIGVLETLRPRRPGQGQIDRRWFGHLGLAVAGVALVALTIGDPFASAVHARGILPIAALAGENTPLAIALGVLAADFLRYWIHRINHLTPPLWRLHALHHADDRPDVTTSFRHHPLEHFLLIATAWVAHIGFGVNAEALIVYGIISAILSPIQHANLRFRPEIERVAQWLLVTNAVHLSHHSTDRRDGAANFGIMFTIWDRLFGTYRAPDPLRAERMRYGLDDVPAQSCASLSAMILLPIRFPARSKPAKGLQPFQRNGA